MSAYSYDAFGMRIDSEFPLELPPRAGSKGAAPPIEVVVGRGRLDFPLARKLGKISYGRDGDILGFDVPWAARYAIEGDSKITVEPIPGARESYLGLYVTGLLLAVILRMRGTITLHGSAVAGAGGGLLFIGDKGAGKSTTAAAMTDFGYKVLCDDVIPIAEGPLVHSGIPFPKLLPDAYEKLIGDARGAEHLFDGMGKYRASVPLCREPVPLRSIFTLEVADLESARIEPLRGAAKLHALIQNTMMLEGIDDESQLFEVVSERLATVPCYKVVRPRGKDSLDEIVGGLLAAAGKGRVP